MRSLDSWLIEEVFEPASYRVEYWSDGKTDNFRLSRFALTPWLACPAAEAASNPTSGNLWLLGITVIGTLFGVLNTWSAKRLAELRPEHIDPSGFRCGAVNLFFRNIWIGFTLGAAAGVALTGTAAIPHLLATIGFGCHLYWLACRRMPPSFKQQQDEKRMQLAPVTT